MAKILSIDDMLEAAGALELPDYARFVALLESAAHSLATAIGNHTGIVAGDATWEGKAMGGLCATFYAASPAQECPEAIHEGDPSGDWEFEGPCKQSPPRVYEVQHEFDFEPTYVCPLDAGQAEKEGRTVMLGKDIPWQDRQVLADVVAEFLSRSADSR